MLYFQRTQKRQKATCFHDGFRTVFVCRIHFIRLSVVATVQKLKNEIAWNMYEASELDWLIYNEPVTYVNLITCGGIEEYLRGYKEHKLQD